MRKILFSLGVAVLISGCAYETPPPTNAAAEAAELQAKTALWEQKWAEAKREVVVARAHAKAVRRPVPPPVKKEVTELLERKVTGPTEDVRLQRLKDSVSDAKRLALLVSVG